jgi:AraC-like DNA-binding protein
MTAVHKAHAGGNNARGMAYLLATRDSGRLWRHLNSVHVFTFVMSGVSRWRYRGLTIETVRPTILIAEPDELQICVQVDTPLTFVAVFVPRALLNERAARLGEPGLRCLPDTVNSRDALDAATCLTASAGQGSSAEQEAALGAVIDGILRDSNYDAVRRRRTTAIRKGEKLIKESYEANTASPARIRWIAEQVGLSYHWFMHSFTKETGSPPHQYLKALRAARAHRLLSEQGTEKLASVAYESGYADASHMNRDFKKAYGITPGRWRACQRAGRQESCPQVGANEPENFDADPSRAIPLGALAVHAQGLISRAARSPVANQWRVNPCDVPWR